jgi:hypothetical protein
MSSSIPLNHTDWPHAGDPSAAGLPRALASEYVKIAGLADDITKAAAAKANDFFGQSFGEQFRPHVWIDDKLGSYVHLTWSPKFPVPRETTRKYAAGIVAGFLAATGHEVV